MTPSTPQSIAESMNNDLQRLYDLHLPEIRLLIDKCDLTSNGELSQIFAMYVDEHYVQANQKILFIGRETFGWYNYDTDCVAADLMKNYSNFSNSENYPNSPFWWFRRDLSQRFGIAESDFRNATLWTNLSKIDVEKARPQDKGEKLDCLNRLIQLFIQLLTAEIAIIKPDVVVIMTRDGFYNWHLENYNWRENKTYFDSQPVPAKLEKRRLEGVRVDQLMGGEQLSNHTYQMCHPRALVSKGGSKANQFIEAIHRSVSESANAL